MDFSKELDDILDNDPLGLLVIKQNSSSVVSEETRLIESFEEINRYIDDHDKEPEESRDISERRMHSRLKNIRLDRMKVTVLMKHDRHGLLEPPKEIETVEDVFDDDILGLLDDEEDDIFTLKHVTKTIDMPEEIARRKPCNEFDKYESLFKQCHVDLKSGKKELRKFTGEQQIIEGHFFILHGVMVYVAKVGEKERKNGKVNARLRLIFENGNESNMLLRSLATELYKDEGGRRVLDPDNDLFPEAQVNEDDDATGYVYVLRSLSDDSQISTIDNLYKIGFSSHPVAKRIQNAPKEPTYLMAGVQVITEFQTFNLDPHRLEGLLHQFFAEVCLDIDIYDSEGVKHKPREWFIVPLHVVESAVQLLINGEIVNYLYDSGNQEVIRR
ncbi:MAG: GIY-YIG nuclease family protein [Gammaproteobacteria bacterium]|jgi:hypothetical protein|nr:GIY-YIG nuclease family protein [Gammaproteobacteria bacterium]